jgi:hypothetical protein
MAARLYFFDERLSPDDATGAAAIRHLGGEVVVICMTNGFP